MIVRRQRVIFCKSADLGLKHVCELCGEIGVLLKAALQGLGLRQGGFLIFCGVGAVWRGYVMLDGNLGSIGDRFRRRMLAMSALAGSLAVNSFDVFSRLKIGMRRVSE
jgi:hypothetical protein